MAFNSSVTFSISGKFAYQLLRNRPVRKSMGLRWVIIEIEIDVEVKNLGMDGYLRWHILSDGKSNR